MIPRATPRIHKHFSKTIVEIHPCFPDPYESRSKESATVHRKALKY